MKQLRLGVAGASELRTNRMAKIAALLDGSCIPQEQRQPIIEKLMDVDDPVLFSSRLDELFERLAPTWDPYQSSFELSMDEARASSPAVYPSAFTHLNYPHLSVISLRA